MTAVKIDVLPLAISDTCFTKTIRWRGGEGSGILALASMLKCTFRGENVSRFFSLSCGRSSRERCTCCNVAENTQDAPLIISCYDGRVCLHTRCDTRANARNARIPANVTRCHRRAASTRRLVNERDAFRFLFAIHVTARDDAHVVSHVVVPLAKLLFLFLRVFRNCTIITPPSLDRQLLHSHSYVRRYIRMVGRKVHRARLTS